MCKKEPKLWLHKRCVTRLTNGVVFLTGIVLIVVLVMLLFAIPGCVSWKEVLEVLNAFVLLLTVMVALNVYVNSTKVEEIKALLELRKYLSKDKNAAVHRLLSSDKSEDSKEEFKFTSSKIKIDDTNLDACDLYDYLGTLELANIMLKNEILTDNQFKSQFGYRVKNVNACKAIRDMLDGQKSYWEELEELLKNFGEDK